MVAPRFSRNKAITVASLFVAWRGCGSTREGVPADRVEPLGLCAADRTARFVGVLVDAAVVSGTGCRGTGFVRTVEVFGLVVLRMLPLPLCCDGNRTVTGRGPGRPKMALRGMEAATSNAPLAVKVQSEELAERPRFSACARLTQPRVRRAPASAPVGGTGSFLEPADWRFRTCFAVA